MAIGKAQFIDVMLQTTKGGDYRGAAYSMLKKSAKVRKLDEGVQMVCSQFAFQPKSVRAWYEWKRDHARRAKR